MNEKQPQDLSRKALHFGRKSSVRTRARDVTQTLAAIAVAVAATACSSARMDDSGGPNPVMSVFPRTTDTGVSLTIREVVSQVPMPGCSTASTTRPIGCVIEHSIQTVTANTSSKTLDLEMSGLGSHGDSLWPINSGTDGDLVVLVFEVNDPRIARIEMTSGSSVVDSVVPVQGTAVVASSRAYDEVTAWSEDNQIVAACPRDGIDIAGVRYPCSSGGKTTSTTDP
jgi:hypothetical protein